MIGGSRFLRFLDDAGAVFDMVLHWLSLYVVPLTIGTFSLVALMLLSSPYEKGAGQAVPFRALGETSGKLTPDDALAAIRRLPADKVRFFDTHLAVTPFWFEFSAPRTADRHTDTIEFPSRHATDLMCWDAQNLAYLGGASRSVADGGISRAKAGFALDASRLARPVPDDVLCRGTFLGPGRISIVAWDREPFQSSVLKFHRDSGLLEGSMVVLALLVLVAAMINREWMFVLFAAWLITSLRLAALSTGSDTQWLGRELPPDWLPVIRKLTIATYYTLTYALFTTLFQSDLKQVGYGPALRIALLTCVPLWVAAIILPYGQFLPIMWGLAVVGIAILFFLLSRILVITKSLVAVWYATSIGIALVASFYEVIAAALGAQEMIGVVNSVTAALASAMMAALAIAEQIRKERLERVHAQVELEATYQATAIGLFTLDAQGNFIRANPALHDMLAPHAEHDKLRRWNEYFEEGAWQALRLGVDAGHTAELEFDGRPRGRDGSRRYLAKATLAHDRIEGSLQDITERAKATAQLQFLAEYDPLTGVLNRRGIEQVIDRAITRIDAGDPLALAYLDLDRFKLINDLFGHLTGDEVLRQVCERIKDVLPSDRQIGRVGGDEFVILFPDTPIADGDAACRRIIDLIANQPYRIGDKAFQVKGSIGLIEVSGGTLVKDALSVADRACRQAKAGGHDNLVTYTSESAAFRERDEELRLIGRFGIGAVPEGLFLEMQPIMSLHDPHGSLDFEVLLRLREADGSVTTAAKIIAAAENNGRISSIDRWVLATTLEWLDAYQHELKNTRFACVNLSGASLNDERFIQDAFAMLNQYSRVAELLCFEITESVALHDLDNTRRFIDRVRNFGARVALDDFGAGYTSFSYLKELPADAVKIDGSFVRDVNAHPANLAIVGAIADLARNLGMKSIAEWAEDCATVEALVEAGVDYVQGYAVARPLDPQHILAAQSAAGLIQRDDVALYVRDSLATRPGTPDLWEEATAITLLRRH